MARTAKGGRTVVTLLVVTSLALGSVAAGSDTREADYELWRSAVADATNAFAVDMYLRLAEKEEGNLFFSPNSIETALAVAWAGARGATAQQMARVLHLPAEPERVHRGFRELNAAIQRSTNKEGCTVEVANGLWGQEGYGFLREYLELGRASYGAGLREVDFVSATGEARATINAWVEEKTHGKVRNLIPEGALSRLTRLVITNAIYFKGLWQMPFDAKETAEADFHVSAEKRVRVPMMAQKGDFGYASTDGWQILEMPYVDGKVAAVFLLPAEGGTLDDAEATLGEGRLQDWLLNLRTRDVKVFLPRFEIVSQFGLADALSALGMPQAFSPKDADFSGMNGTGGLFISSVLHKAYVKVDEEGTEAAAATGVVVGLTSMPPPPVVFRADRPFVFLIRHRPTGAILFLGRVAEPGAGLRAADETVEGAN
jgi:serpin B